MTFNRKVILKEDFIFNDYKYKKDDIFTIIGESYRGLDLQHDESGNRIYETLFISDKFTDYSIKKERKKKLKNLNKK